MQSSLQKVSEKATRSYSDRNVASQAAPPWMKTNCPLLPKVRKFVPPPTIPYASSLHSSPSSPAFPASF